MLPDIGHPEGEERCLSPNRHRPAEPNALGGQGVTLAMRFEHILRDARYALRDVRKKPGFAAAIIVTLAVGIGANAAMFGIVDRLLVRTPPLLRDPDSVHRIYYASTSRGKEFTGNVGRYVRFTDFTQFTKSFSSTAGWTTRDMAIGLGDNAREMRVGIVSSTFFGFFDAPPELGRYFKA